MKQAILITAYKDLSFLLKIIEHFDEDFDFYIHIDKKCSEDRNIFDVYKNVKVFSQYKIYWGSDNHLLAILHLLDKAYDVGGYCYYHLITGSDYPIKTNSEFKGYFDKNNKRNYLEYHLLPRASWGREGGLERIKYFWVGNRFFDIRGKYGKITRYLIKVQRKLNILRNISIFNKYYGGGTYWSLSVDAVGYIIHSIQSKDLIKHFKFSHCAEELFFQTVLLNADENFNVINNSLRYIIWSGNASSPNVLNENNYEEICHSDCFFARKIERGLSDKLINMIDENCKSN